MYLLFFFSVGLGGGGHRKLFFAYTNIINIIFFFPQKKHTDKYWAIELQSLPTTNHLFIINSEVDIHYKRDSCSIRFTALYHYHQLLSKMYVKDYTVSLSVTKRIRRHCFPLW